ncbi:histidine kinase CKI1-like [Chenopodium quinoa]|uniref:histidine kinase CKI1-like n=1 Tax=Chenopodium quinoa TaxID=63459 RepID=UPI000B7965CC|nr:histidine kinase CKI1-like [Chenopodium quinoa]
MTSHSYSAPSFVVYEMREESLSTVCQVSQGELRQRIFSSGGDSIPVVEVSETEANSNSRPNLVNGKLVNCSRRFDRSKLVLRFISRLDDSCNGVVEKFIFVEYRYIGFNSGCLLCFSSDRSCWVIKRAYHMPGMDGWRDDGVFEFAGRLFWVDLSRGMITWDDDDPFRSVENGERAQYTARLGSVGAISLGFSSDEITTIFSSTDFLGASLYMATLGDDKVLIDDIKDADITIMNGKAALVQASNKANLGEISCKSIDNGVTNVSGTSIDIGGANFIFYCSSIDVARVPMVYVLAYPSNRLISIVHNHTKVELILQIIMVVDMVIYVFAFVTLIVRAARREVHLCAAYMREMEKTTQAERKSIKQSLAFASANHDVRGYLACIKGLTELSAADLPPSSEVASSLRKIDTCAEDLLALVNSILDFSKIEAGKMQLEENEFNLAQLIEDVADLHHPVAMKKGVEVILDPSDGSIFRYSQVRGDRGKLKQILGNLLSNAVKFTSQGNICITCHSKKPSFENSIIASNRNNLLNRLSSFFHKNKRAYNDLEDMKTIKQDPNCMEFEFQVEDTGPGIPKEKRHLIFENFVQVKENSAEQVGTGLGLGIVQSLVRLMGGDIEIVDKANGEQGTCFKFNIFLIVQDECLDNPRQELTEHREINSGSGLSTCVRSPRGDKSIVILLIKDDARRRMVHRYMESLGVNLKVLSHGKQLSSNLKKIKSMLIEPQYNNSVREVRHEPSSRSLLE